MILPILGGLYLAGGVVTALQSEYETDRIAKRDGRTVNLSVGDRVHNAATLLILWPLFRLAGGG